MKPKKPGLPSYFTEHDDYDPEEHHNGHFGDEPEHVNEENPDNSSEDEPAAEVEDEVDEDDDSDFID